MKKQTTLRTRIRGREDFYLNLVTGSTISIVSPDESIVGCVECREDGSVAMKAHGQNGWTTIRSNGYDTPTVKEGVSFGWKGEEEGGKVILSPETIKGEDVKDYVKEDW